MTTIIIKVDVSQLDAEDVAAVRTTCEIENKRREVASVELLDFSTGALRRAYYESFLAEAVMDIHRRNIKIAERNADSQKEFQELRAAWKDASPEQREAALKAMTTPVTG